jgi:GR25 family glycosyltransferase involved in LPS biosynthesis
MIPPTFAEFCSAPTFLVNMERNPERLVQSTARLATAGFTDIRRFAGVDAKSADLPAEWAKHGSPTFWTGDRAFCETHKGKQGCMLSHLNLLRHVIQEEIPFFVVFEDDVLFHSRWAELAPAFYAETPQDFHLLYMGAWVEETTDVRIIKSPLLCTNAMAMTLEGAKMIYSFLTTYQTGTYTIDCMLYNLQQRLCAGWQMQWPLRWYGWNTRSYGAPASKKNLGLVLQDDVFVSEVCP